MNDSGFDESRSLLVMSARQTTTLYLIEGTSDDLKVEVEDSTIATVNERDQTKALHNSTNFTKWERTQDIHKLTVKALKVGDSTLTAKLPDGRDWIDPITIRVVDNADYRQAGDKNAITPELRQELQQLELRDAVLRVAEDQMNSKIGRTSGGGYGRYGIDKGWEWCGAFAFWCWKTACAAKGVSNPFGDRLSVLLSPQKAISWALQTGDADILRYEGGDPYGNSFVTGKPLGKAAKSQKFVDIDDDGGPLEPADIVLVRADDGWKHVAMVWETPDGDDLESIDGNQGMPSIQRRTRSLSKKVRQGKDYALVFLHVDV
jgi:hypothetical protein